MNKLLTWQAIVDEGERRVEAYWHGRALPKPVNKPCYVEYIHEDQANLTPYTLVGEIVPSWAGKPIYRHWILLEACYTRAKAIEAAKLYAPNVRAAFKPQDVNAMPQEILY